MNVTNPPLLHIPGKLDLVKLAEKGTGYVTLHFQTLVSPSFDEVKTITDVVIEFAASREAPFLLWIEHVGEGDLEFPDMMGMLHISGRLLEHRDLVKETLIGTCIQAKELGGVFMAAKELFLNVYQPVAPFDVIVGGDECHAFMSKCRSKYSNRKEK